MQKLFVILFIFITFGGIGVIPASAMDCNYGGTWRTIATDGWYWQPRHGELKGKLKQGERDGY